MNPEELTPKMIRKIFNQIQIGQYVTWEISGDWETGQVTGKSAEDNGAYLIYVEHPNTLCLNLEGCLKNDAFGLLDMEE